MQHTLVAVFDNRSDAQNAMDELLASGFSRNEVRLSSADPTGQTDSLTGTETVPTENRDDGIGASIKHFFTDLFGSDNSEHANRYSTAVSRGHHVLTVTAADEPEVERAADIVERHGPTDIDEQAAQWAGGAAMGQTDATRLGAAGAMQQSAGMSAQSAPGASQQGSAGAASALQGSQQRDTSAAAAIPVVQEELKVGKREVQRGGVRVFSRVVETPVNESIGLREEHVNVERHAVDQPISPADATAFKEQTIELRETAEEAVVEKSARVVEEVVVGKEVTQREEQISDTVRHTEVEVERLGGQYAQSNMMDDDAYFRSHWSSYYGASGGAYEDYAPAYSYGSEMARSGSYSGRKWDEIESDMRTGWESRHPGESTWDKMKDAVRHGWERMMGRDEDEHYRTHWNSTYGATGGTYDEYRPAYSYGSEMARSEMYRGRPWNDVETDLRSGWEQRGGGQSTWEKMKAAIRHGWDRVTS